MNSPILSYRLGTSQQENKTTDSDVIERVESSTHSISPIVVMQRNQALEVEH